MPSTDLEIILSLKSSIATQNKTLKLPIKKCKLPSDFFKRRQRCNNTSMEQLQGYSTEENSPRAVTPSFKEIQNIKKRQNNLEKYMRFKAQNDVFKGEELFKDVMAISRNLNRFIGKQCADIKICSQSQKRRNLLPPSQQKRKGSRSKQLSKKQQNKDQIIQKLPQIISNRFKNYENFSSN